MLDPGVESNHPFLNGKVVGEACFSTTVSGDSTSLCPPGSTTGPGSAQFTVNVMYVTGQITGAVVNADSATLTGTASITGLGAGTNVSFTFEVHKGGPGATSVLKVASLPSTPFNEILIEGEFKVLSNRS